MFQTRCWVRSGSVYVGCLKITRSVSTWNIDSQEHEQCSVSFALIESYLLRSETEPQGVREGGRDGYGWVEWYCRLCSVNGEEKHEIPSELCTLGSRPALPLPHWFSSGKKEPWLWNFILNPLWVQKKWRIFLMWPNKISECTCKIELACVSKH